MKEIVTYSKVTEIKSVQDLINFFDAIDEKKWCVGVLQNGMKQRCAMGHLAGLQMGAGDESDVEKIDIDDFCDVETHLHHIGVNPNDIVVANNGDYMSPHYRLGGGDPAAKRRTIEYLRSL